MRRRSVVVRDQKDRSYRRSQLNVFALPTSKAVTSIDVANGNAEDGKKSSFGRKHKPYRILDS